MVKQYTPTERKGINFVESKFLDMEWVFREQTILDFGIDAHAEVCDEGRPTGRVIAIQVKSGVSYFEEKTNTGIIFRGEVKHLNYWKNHSLPVILVLYHPVEKKAIWCHIRGDQLGINITPKGWNVEVPKSQCFDESAFDQLRNIASPNFLSQARYLELAHVLQRGQGAARFRALLDAMHVAERSIDVISPYMDSTLFLALAFCSHRVPVRLLTEPYAPADATEEHISGDHNGIEWRTSKSLHDKIIILDRFLVINTSSNFSRFGWRGRNHEAVYCSCDTVAVASVVTNFEKVWTSGIPQAAEIDFSPIPMCS